MQNDIVGKMLVNYNPTKQFSHNEIGTFLSQFDCASAKFGSRISCVL